jgi:hypothetical protein
MTSRFVVAVALAGLAFSSAVSAEQAGTPAQSQDDAQSKVVCKSVLRTGTRFKERTCKTVKQWDVAREQQRREASELVDKPLVSGARSN